MARKKSELRVNPNFKNLIPPLSPAKYAMLEKDLRNNGCHDPIVTWNGLIIDGHNRYEICRKHNIPFSHENLFFADKEEVISWICKKQLEREDICDAARKYLIGKLTITEKEIVEKKKGKESSDESPDSKQNVLMQVGIFSHSAMSTVVKYTLFARTMDTIFRKAPDLTRGVLSGKYRMSHESAIQISKLPRPKMQELVRRVAESPPTKNNVKLIRENLFADLVNAKPPANSIKDMPPFDPDAEITGLILTIPSWVGSLNRVQKTNFSITSLKARSQLMKAISVLIDASSKLLCAINPNGARIKR